MWFYERFVMDYFLAGHSDFWSQPHCEDRINVYGLNKQDVAKLS